MVLKSDYIIRQVSAIRVEGNYCKIYASRDIDICV